MHSILISMKSRLFLLSRGFLGGSGPATMMSTSRMLKQRQAHWFIQAVHMHLKANVSVGCFDKSPELLLISPLNCRSAVHSSASQHHLILAKGRQAICSLVPVSSDISAPSFRSQPSRISNSQRFIYRMFSTQHYKQKPEKHKKLAPLALLKEPSNRRGLRCLMDCMIKESPIVVPTFIALLASSALISMFPAVVGTYINNFSATNVPSIFQGACFVICSAFASFMKSTLSGFANTRIARRLREDLYISFLRKDISFFDTNTSGRLASILASDVAVSSVVIDYLCQALRASISFVSGIFFSLKLAPIALIGHTMMPIALSFGLIFPLSRCVQKHTSLQMKRLAALVSHTEERISNIKTVKAFNAEKYEHGAFMLKIHDLFVSAITSTLYTASMNFIAVGAVGSLILLMVNTSATLVLDGTMKIGDVTSLLMYSALVGGSIQSFTSSVAGIQRCVGAAASVASYIDDNAILPINKVPTILKAPSIEFNNICFTYPSRPDLQILDDVSFLLPAGSKLLIFGESGCGKSSIIQLLLGFYKPNSGSISIDGRSLNDIDIGELRYMSGWVEQQGTLFNDSIRNNVLYGLENEMVDLSGPYKQSGLLEIVKSMPEGDQTNVGQLGKALSGGQRQRVSVARMFARNPKLVLLDEASSALDMESERQLNNALIKFLHDKTAIVVSHRTSLLPMADYIMVMTSGKISQFGTKDEVLKAPCQQLITMLSVE